MAKRAFTEHPEFSRVSRLVNEALAEVADRLGCMDALNIYSEHTNRVADDLTKLMLRAYDYDCPVSALDGREAA